MPCAETAPLPLAATAITVLAGDGFTLAVGLLLLGGVSSLRVTAAAAVCLTVAFTVAGPGEFAALRATPPEGWSAALLLLLVLAAAGAMSRVSPAIAGYLVLRVLFDLCGVGQPLWWGVPLLVAGAAIAAIGSLRAALADTLHTVVSAGSLHLFGMATMALGVALFARAVDLPSVTSQALDAAWLALVGHVLCRTLLLGCADATENGAGTRRLDRLGGLIHRMPVTAGSCLVGLFAVAVLPPGLGFAAFWLLFQSLLAAARIGEIGPQVLVVCVAALAALSVGLAGLAAVRLFGVVFLGVPRTPRAAVADDAPRPVRYCTRRPGGSHRAARGAAGSRSAAGRRVDQGDAFHGIADPAHRCRDARLFAGCRWQGCSPWPGLPPCGYRAAPANSDASRCGPAVSPHRRHGCRSAIRRRSTGLLPSPRRYGAFWRCRRRSPRSMIASVDAAKRCCALRRRWWHRGAIGCKIDSVVASYTPAFQPTRSE